MDFDSDIAGLVSAGLALHWLKPRSKAPVDDGWSTAPVATESDLRASYQAGMNLGVRPGEFSKVGDLYLHLIDLDIRDETKTAEALKKLHELAPAIDTFPFVISGSGGSSRHFYFLTDKPFRSKKLAHSANFTNVFDNRLNREVRRWDWEIELYGTGKQAAMPPSIHPNTGKPYVRGRPIDLDALDMGIGPVVTSDQVALWSPQRVDEDAEPRPTLGMSLDEARRVLKDIPLDVWCEDREGWLQVGMALHHEFGGSKEGYDLWTEFSKQSTKFVAKDQEAVWRSFRTKTNSVRMATLIDAAKKARIARIDEDFDEEPEDDEDLLGEVHTETDSDDDDLLGEIKGTTPIEEDRSWEQLLDWSDGEKPALKPTLHNIELILTNDPRFKGVIRFNELLEQVVYAGEPGIYRRGRKGVKPKKQLKGSTWKLKDPINGDRWTDAKDNVIRNILMSPKSQGGWNLKVAKTDVHDSVDMVARTNSFHPVQDYLSGLAWDGVARLDTMFIDWLGSPDTAYNRNISRLVLLGAVTRAFEPGHKFDYVAILEGVQGKRKSTWIETLGKFWFAELHGDFADNQKMVERMQGYWILELPELQGFTKGEIQEIKAFVSAKSDTTRLSYDRRAGQFPRQCVFIGSTNEAEYLKDNTGGRRFWPVECHVGSIDIDGFAAVVDQLWAEAMTVYRSMRAAQPKGALPLYLSDEAAADEAIRMQESRRVETVEDTITGRVDAWSERPMYGDFDEPLIDGPGEIRNEMCLIEIWVECLGNDPRSYDQRAAQMLGKAMKNLRGWVNVGLKNTQKYGRQRCYWRKGWNGLK